MAVQIWKSDHERPGRHFVYTGRYVHFLVGILYRLKDKESIELLAKRIRKRAGEFVDHIAVWQDITNAYLSVSASFLHPKAFAEQLLAIKRTRGNPSRP